MEVKLCAICVQVQGLNETNAFGGSVASWVGVYMCIGAVRFGGEH